MLLRRFAEVNGLRDDNDDFVAAHVERFLKWDRVGDPAVEAVLAVDNYRLAHCGQAAGGFYDRQVVALYAAFGEVYRLSRFAVGD